MHPHNTSVHTFTLCMIPTTKEEPTTTCTSFIVIQPYDINTSIGAWNYGITYHHRNKFLLQTLNPRYIYVRIWLPFYLIVAICLYTTSNTHPFILIIWNNFNLNFDIKISHDIFTPRFDYLSSCSNSVAIYTHKFIPKI